MNRKTLIYTFIGILILATAISAVDATPTNNTQKRESAVGAGVFIHEHDGVPHSHYFKFSVSDCPRSAPKGNFDLVCKHDGQIETIIISTRITSFDVQRVQGGLEATFTGKAFVKMGNEPFTGGWTFIVNAFDFNGAGADQIGITLFDPQGQVHCQAEPTQLTSGNIVIHC